MQALTQHAADLTVFAAFVAGGLGCEVRLSCQECRGANSPGPLASV